MKYAIYAVAAITTSSMVGCAKSSDETKSAPPPGDTKALKVVTDTSVCGRGPVARGLDGTWASDQMSVDGRFQLQMRFTFQGQSLTLSNQCKMAGRSLVASVTVPISSNGRQLTVLGKAHDNEKIDEEGFHMNCNVNAEAGTMSYELSGSCLKFIDPKSGQELILVPVTTEVPAPQPHPVPQPVPPVVVKPAPQPFPIPQPDTPSASYESWACLEHNTITDQVFIGYGPSLEIAQSEAKQSCRRGESSHYCGDQAIDCARQEGYRDSWFCEVSNTITDAVFTGKGMSRVEATYNAEKACVSGESSHYCQSGSSVKCSRF